MKNVVLIGASGFAGTAILNELLNKGHKVTALVRNSGKVTKCHPDLTVMKADVSDVSGVAEAARGKDAVISAYNSGWKNPGIYEETLKNYPLIVKAVKQSGVKRLLCAGGAGTLFCAPGLRVVDSDAIPAGTLKPGKRTGKFRLGKDDLIADGEGKSRISVEDYAMAMVDELEREDHHRERFTIGY